MPPFAVDSKIGVVGKQLRYSTPSLLRISVMVSIVFTFFTSLSAPLFRQDADRQREPFYRSWSHKTFCPCIVIPAPASITGQTLSRNPEAFANSDVPYSWFFLDSSFRWNDAGFGAPE
jgi:hypothetical protein